jgi:hypothetical protein
VAALLGRNTFSSASIFSAAPQYKKFEFLFASFSFKKKKRGKEVRCG